MLNKKHMDIDSTWQWETMFEHSIRPDILHGYQALSELMLYYTLST